MTLRTCHSALFSLFLVALLLSPTACDSVATEPPDTEAASLPLLPPGFTLGTTLYGSAQLPEPGRPERALLDDAVAQGLRGFTYYVDWPDLEPEPGRYTLDDFTDTLDRLRDLGVQPFVNITVGDIEDYNLPSGLSDGAGGLAEGVSLDDPAVLERFGLLLDRVVPLLTARGGFLLGVGNEVDERLDHASRDERAAYARFAEAARERVHALEPRLAVGVTLTGNAVRTQSSTYRALRPAVDVIPFNYGPIRVSNFTVYEVENIQTSFRQFLDASGEGPIVIQELTCPSPSSMGASETWQRACFEQLFEMIEATPQVRFASIFTFQDFDEATCEIIRDAMFGETMEDLPEELAERLTDYLCYLGVVDPDGNPKPAWQTVLDAAATLLPADR